MDVTVDDIDLSVELSTGLLVEGTNTSYRTYLKKFAIFLKQEYVLDMDFPVEWLTDDNVAKFLCYLSQKYNFKPHHRKTAIAALNYMNEIVGVPNIYDEKHLWPSTHKMLKKWDASLKVQPYFPKQASYFNREAMLSMCSLVCEDNFQLLDRTIVVLSSWTSMRSEDMVSLLSKNVTRLLPSQDTPRRWGFYLEQTKNDPAGQGPRENREFMLPCICLDVLTPSQKQSFKKDLKRDPGVECPCPCPFQVIGDYIKLIPDPFGRCSEANGKKNPRFIRALTTRGMRRFTENPLGLQQLGSH